MQGVNRDNQEHPSPLTYSLITNAGTWNGIVRSLPYHHVLQSWEWGEFKHRYGWVPERLAFSYQGDDRVVAAAQVLSRRASPAPVAVLYVPKGPVLDYTDHSLRRMVLDALAAFARKRQAIFIKIDPDVVAGTGDEEVVPQDLGLGLIKDLSSGGWRFSRDQIQFRNTVQLDLLKPEEDLLAAMKQKTRYNIRLAERKGVVIRPGKTEELPLLFDMYAETAARDQFIIRPLEYYKDAWEDFMNAGLANALVAESEGLAIAAIILFCFGDRVWYMYGASRNVGREKMPNHLLQWEAVRWAKNQGYSVYDMWGAPNEFIESDPMWGVWRFKSGFGGDVVRHIGAWDRVISRTWHWIYTVAIPFYLAVRRSFAKRGLE